MTERTGGCLCGNVRYTAHGEPLAVAICHCIDCRKQTSSAFSVIAAFPADAYAQTGTTKTHHGKGDSGTAVARHFCGSCGSPIASKIAANPDMIMIKVGTFDDPAAFRPEVEVYTDHAAHWLPPLAKVRFQGPPTEAG